MTKAELIDSIVQQSGVSKAGAFFFAAFFLAGAFFFAAFFLAGAAFLAAAFLRLGAAFFFIGVTWYSFLLLWCCLLG